MVSNNQYAALVKLPFVVIDDENCEDRHILRQSSREVSFPLSDQHRELALELRRRMVDQDRCVGLAAPQIGQPWRIIAVHVNADLCQYRTDVDTLTDPIILINPSFKALSDERQANWEGCFSVNGHMGKIRRYHHIEYQGWDIEGHMITGQATGLLARVIQHEIDHINGQLIIDLFEDDLPHGPKDEMLLLRDQEFDQYKKTLAERMPYVAIDNSDCCDRHMLQQPAQLVPLPLSAVHKKLAIDLKLRMIYQDNCVGLAAPQVGVPLRIVAIQIDNIDQNFRPDSDMIVAPMVLINPTYRPLSDDTHVDWEGCFSVNKSMGQIRRYTHIAYQGWDLNGHKVTGEAHNFFARVLQHEIDHADGRLIIDLFEDGLHHGPVDDMRRIWQAQIDSEQAISI